jgi:threonine dehydrogenase-like Zn-dependent dehydrogenase
VASVARNLQLHKNLRTLRFFAVPKISGGQFVNYNAIIIGSGVGGLTAAVALSQSGINAAITVLNSRTRDILTQNGASLMFLPSDGTKPCQSVA